MSSIRYEKFNLYDCIRNICTSIPSEIEMSHFIKLCIRYSLAYLNLKQNHGYRISETNLESLTEFENIAVDSIAELFQRNTTGEFLQLRKYFFPLL